MEGETDIPVPTLPAPVALPDASGPPSILIDTVLLILLRIGYFYLARRYLLAQLNPALRQLQKPEAGLPTHTHHARDRSQDLRARDRANSRASVASVKSARSTHSVRSTASGSGSVAGPSTGGARSSRPSSSVLDSTHHGAAADSLPSDIEDTEDDPSSYPPSVSGTPPTRKIQLAHGDVSPPGQDTPTGSSSHQPIEMSLLGAKLQNRPRPQVLELSHARAERSLSRAGKRAARGLGRVARTLFAVCFAESMNLLTLVVFQALGILHWHGRQFNFSVSLYALLAIILLVVPLVQCLLFTYRSRESNATSTGGSSLSFTSRLLISFVPFVLYVFAFTRIPPYITVMDDWEGSGWLAPSLGRVVVLGIFIMAALSGIGAVKTAWDYLEQAAGGGRRITDADVVQAERSLYRVRQDVVAKRDDINRISASQPERSNGWMGGVFGSKESQQLGALKAELQGLQAMETELARSLAGMKTKQQRQGFRKTFAGSVVNLLGYVFAAYCVARLLMCLVSLFVTPFATSTVDDSPAAKGNTNGDWISFIIALGLSHLPFTGDLDIATWSRGISLLLTGLLILSSLTMVLRWLTRVLRMTSKTVGAGFLLLFLGQIYATYVISLLVQLRSSLPASSDEINSVVHSINDSFGSGSNGTSVTTASESMAAAATSAAATATAVAVAAASAVSAPSEDSLLRSLPDFRVFGRLFDAVFLAAALGTAVYRYIAMRVERTDDGAIFSVGR